MTTNNPFEALGGGGFDMNALLQQAQALQEQLQSTQAELAEKRVEGSVAGGAVTVTVTGTGELDAVHVEPGVVDGADAGSLADLGELVVAAYRDACAEAEKLAGESLGPLTGGLMGGDAGGATPPGLPPGFGLPPSQA